MTVSRTVSSRASFKALIGSNVKQGVTVQADKGANWDSVAKVLAVIQAAGVTTVGMATETESPPR